MSNILFEATTDTTGAGIALALGIFVCGVLIVYLIKFIIWAIKFLLKKKNKT
jgi:hypothetical protein